MGKNRYLFFYKLNNIEGKKVWYSIQKEDLYYDFDDPISIGTIYSQTGNQYALISSDHQSEAGKLYKLQDQLELLVDRQMIADLGQLSFEVNYDQKLKIDTREKRYLYKNKLWILILVLSILGFLLLMAATITIIYCIKKRRERNEFGMYGDMSYSAFDLDHAAMAPHSPTYSKFRT